MEELKQELKELKREFTNVQMKLIDFEARKNMTDRDLASLKDELREIKQIIGQTEDKLDERVTGLNKTLIGLAVTFIVSISGAILSYILSKF